MGRTSVALAVLVALAGCASSAPRCERPVRPPGDPFLWKVQRDDGPVLWLFGTIHDAGEADVPAAAWAALDRATRYASELGDLEPDGDALRDVMRLPRGRGLDQQLPADVWYDLRDALRGVIDEAELARARPWYAMSLLTRTASPPPDTTMDEALTARAAARRLPVDHLETWAQQLGTLAESVTIADLAEAIEARREIRCELAGNRAAYAAGDLDAVTRIYGGSALLARHQAWLPALEAYLGAEGAFVAVGIGHLVGDAGLPALLARAGYRVTRAR